MKQCRFKIRKGDTVQVITGSDKGKRGVVKKVLREINKVVVENVRVVTRHIRPDYRYPQGSFKKEMPIHISNVALVDIETDHPSRIGYKYDEHGNKVRFFKKSGCIVPEVQ